MARIEKFALDLEIGLRARRRLRQGYLACEVCSLAKNRELAKGNLIDSMSRDVDILLQEMNYNVENNRTRFCSKSM
jgi:hypothetical protein